MRRLLIVSPHFPPVHAPDHQRARRMLPHLAACGWEAEVLAVQPDQCTHPIDPLLERALPPGLAVHRVGALPRGAMRLLGLGSLGLRALPFLARRGDGLLRTGRFDAVLVTTTVFDAMTLGARWKTRFGVPYMLDYQDPWLTDYYDRPGAPPPPGGQFKYRLAQMLGERLEPRALSAVDRVIAVSAGYIEQLCARYPSLLREEQCRVVPFGAPEEDFRALDRLDVRPTLFDPGDGVRRIVYIGAVGTVMRNTVRLLMRGLKQAVSENPEVWSGARLLFAGTSYAPKERAEESVLPIAREEGVADYVEERTARLPYFETLATLSAAHGVLVLGSDDPDYTASKLFTCALSGRPVLGVLHASGSAADLLEATGAGEAVRYGGGTEEQAAVRACADSLQRLVARPPEFVPVLDRAAIEPRTDAAMTRTICALLEECATSEPSAGE